MKKKSENMIPKLSVIVPVYNVENYLTQCLDSLIGQTLKEIEIILVNDGSTDHSEEICLNYAKRDKRIKVYSKSNGGLSDARNYGMQRASAKVIGFVDSDDYVDLNMFQILLSLKERYHAEVAVGGVKMAANDGEVYMVRAVDDDRVLNRHDAMEELLKSKRITNSVCNKIFDVSLFEEVEFPLGKLYEDEYVTYKLFDRADRIVMTNQVYYYYRSSPNSITHKSFSEREFDRIYASQIKVEYISNNYIDLTKYAERYLVYDCVMSLSKMTVYKKSYNEIVCDPIREHLVCFLRGDYSFGTKVFAIIAAISPNLSVSMFNIIGKRMIRK